jgi:hypothetical protein
VTYVIGFTWFINITYHLMSEGSFADKEQNFFVSQEFFEWDEAD